MNRFTLTIILACLFALPAVQAADDAAPALRDRLSSIEGLHAEIPTEHQMSKLI